VPDGPSFASIDCRIEQLLADVQAESRLGKVQQKLVNELQVAKSRKEDAETKCGSGDAKHARKRLQQTAQKLTQFAHTLRSNASRKKIPAEVRDPLAQRADAIGGDAKTLRGQLTCSAT